MLMFNDEEVLFIGELEVDETLEASTKDRLVD